MQVTSGLKYGLVGLLALTTWQAQADYKCNVNPKDDIVITSQHVQVVGASGNLLISPNGDVSQHGKTLNLTAKARQQAVNYQAALRRDLPWIDQNASSHLDKARVAIDGVIVKQLGSDSNVRHRLTKLSNQLKQQMNRIIEHRSDGLAFHHQAIAQVETEGRRILEQNLGGVMQDSVNEMGIKQVTSGGNPLQAMMNNLGELQQSIRTEWRKNEADFQQLGQDVCTRVTSLETQRKSLLAEIKS